LNSGVGLGVNEMVRQKNKVFLAVGPATSELDGRKMHPMYLLELTRPEESKYPGDFYNTRAVVPAEEEARPLEEGRVPAGGGIGPQGGSVENRNPPRARGRLRLRKSTCVAALRKLGKILCPTCG